LVSNEHVFRQKIRNNKKYSIWCCSIIKKLYILIAFFKDKAAKIIGTGLFALMMAFLLLNGPSTVKI
jgi:hypothetical protein